MFSAMQTELDKSLGMLYAISIFFVIISEKELLKHATSCADPEGETGGPEPPTPLILQGMDFETVKNCLKLDPSWPEAGLPPEKTFWISACA